MSKELSVSQILDAAGSRRGLKTIAPVMKRVAACISDKDMDFQALQKIIRCDVAIVTNMLATANRPGQYDSPVPDFNSAIERIGQQTVRNLALSTEFIHVEPGSMEENEENDALQWLWERSLFNATGAEVMAQWSGKDDLGFYHTSGLMLEIGIHFLLNVFTEQYLPVLNCWRTEEGSLVEIEHDMLGINHLVVGQHLARTWNLGTVFEEAIGNHFDPDSTVSDDSHLEILHFATLASDVFFRMMHVQAIERISCYSEQKFGLDTQKLANLLQRIALKADQSAYLVSSGMIKVSSTDLLQIINTELGRATLSYDQMVRELQLAMKKAKMLAKKLEETNKKLREAANIDPLTKIYNRRFFEEFLTWNFQRARRYDNMLGCLMIDIDFFKKINDNYGHLAGDRVLQGVAGVLKESLRSTDILARYGGEEFIVLLPESSPTAVCLTAKKLHKTIADEPFHVEDEDMNVTVSIGYHYYSGSSGGDIKNPEDLVRYADEKMYQAKRNGRNQIWPPEEEGLKVEDN